MAGYGTQRFMKKERAMERVVKWVQTATGAWSPPHLTSMRFVPSLQELCHGISCGTRQAALRQAAVAPAGRYIVTHSSPNYGPHFYYRQSAAVHPELN